MAKPRGGLGKGLGSLFEESASARSDSTTTLPLREIEPDRDQPRKEFDEESIAQLAASIAEHGLLQPIAVRPNPMGGYKIIAGERRWRAARQAGLTEVPVVVREDVTDQQAMELALIENLQREDLNPIEEATGYRQLMDRCGLTQEQAAQRLCRSRSAVANSLRLLNLPGEVTEMLRDAFDYRPCKSPAGPGQSRAAEACRRAGGEAGAERAPDRAAVQKAAKRTGTGSTGSASVARRRGGSRAEGDSGRTGQGGV